MRTARRTLVSAPSTVRPSLCSMSIAFVLVDPHPSRSGFGGDRERAHEAGQKGGATQPDSVYKPSEHDGLKKDGSPDKRLSADHGFVSSSASTTERGDKSLTLSPHSAGWKPRVRQRDGPQGRRQER